MDSVKYIGNAADANSGIYHINEVNAGIKDGSWPTNYKIENSLRFNSISSSYLSRTFGTPTDNNNYTFSCWFKLSNLNSDMQFFAARPTANPYTLFYYKYSGIIEFADNSVTGQYSWNHILRDTSSWYHLVLSVSATGTDRLKLYINNVLNTKSAGTDPNNNSTLLNSAVAHAIGSGMPSTTNYFNGYLANIHFIDGQALDPSHFATTHPVTGRWVPKPYRGTYGTNGFHLDFSNKNSGTGVGTIGEDKSGNGNHWTSNNLDHSDVVPDSPTNNFATLNPLAPDINNSFSMSEGNLRLYTVSSFTSDGRNISTIPFVPAMGKIYIESAKHNGAFAVGFSQGNNAFAIYGRTDINFEIIAGTNNNGQITWQYRSNNGNFPFLNTSATEVIGLLIDFTNSQFKIKLSSTDYTYSFSHNSWINFSNTENIVLVCSNGGASGYGNLNFGQDPTFAGAKVPSKVYTDSNNQGRFFYQPPEGALALCEANINQPEITPNQYPIDETNQHRLTYNGNVQQSKFTPYATDGYSGYFNGALTYAKVSNGITAIGTSDYTIEAWVYHTDISGQQTYTSDTFGNNSGLYFYKTSSHNVGVYYDLNFSVSGSIKLSPNKWYHVCAKRESGTVYIYVDGILDNSASDGTRNLTETVFTIGDSEINSSNHMKGYISDLRLNYNAVTPSVGGPTSPLTSDATYTQLLISSNSKQFVDSSSNAYTITTNGSPEISDWSPYTPELVRKGVHFRRPEDYGGGSFYLSGSGQQILFPTNTDFDFGSGEFSVEMWVYLKSVITGNTPLFGYGNDAGTDYTSFHFAADGKLQFYQSGSISFIETTASVLVGQWNHLVFSRSGNTINVYSNGQKVITNNFTNATRSGHNLRIGSWYNTTNYGSNGNLNGYITDYKIVKGTTVYSEDGNGNITPPTGPLTSDANTKLLLQPWQTATTRGVFTIPNTYKQDETGKSLTYVGNANVVNTSPYKNGVIGGFNSKENGNVISTNNHSDFNFGTGPFTMEAWIKREANSTDRRVIFNKGDRSVNSFNTNEYAWMITNTEFQIHYPGGVALSGGSDLSGVNIYDWMHVVWERVSGGGINFYVNGIKTSSHTYNFNLDNTLNFEIGGSVSANEKGVGLYSDVRIVKGQALYGGTNFIPPAYSLSSTHYTTNGQDPSDSNSTRTPIIGTVSLLVQPGTGFTKNSAAQNPKKYFNTLLYTGNGGTQSITGLDFKPDLVWIKSRSGTSGAFNHALYDSVRGVGANKELTPNETYTEGGANSSQYGYVSTLGVNGFSIGAGSINSTQINGSSTNYVAWCWKAGGNSNTFNINGTGYGTYNELQTANTSLPASSTSGMIVPSGMSINTDAGFSIVKYIGTGSTGGIVPHGLNKKPDMVIIKNLDDGARSWNVTSFITTPSTVLTADTFNIGSKTGGVLGLNYPAGGGAYTIDGQTSGSGQNHIAYCWHSVEGYSKCGSYTGNGSPDGPFVYTGFRPAMILLKSTSVEEWGIVDNARDPYNSTTKKRLFPHLADQENDAAVCDFLSNGFKVNRGGGGTFNVSTRNYIFMAFAEQPFTKTTAR